jgi:thiol:disulfide interchange protein DsbG
MKLLEKLLIAAVVISVAGCSPAGNTAKADNSAKTTAAATDKPANPVDAGKALIAKVTKGELEVVSDFKEGDGLLGYVVKPKQGGREQIMFTDDQARYAFYGIAFDKDGKNLTEAANEKYIQPAVLAGVMKSVDKTAWFQQGKADAPHQMYVAVDPNCIFCHRLFKAAQPFIEKGQLTVRWIVVGFLKPSSPGKAAAILAAKDPVKALEEDEKSFIVGSEEGGIKPLAADKIPSEITKKLDTNMAFFRDNNLGGTPAIIYYDTSQGKPHLVSGMPRNLEQFLANVGKFSDHK